MGYGSLMARRPPAGAFMSAGLIIGIMRLPGGFWMVARGDIFKRGSYGLLYV